MKAFNRVRVAKYIVVAVLFIIGASIFMYPVINSFINEQSQTLVVSNYEEAIKALSEDDKAASIDYAKAYNEALAHTQRAIEDPFGEAPASNGDIEQGNVEIVSLLSIGDVIGSIQIPKIGVKLPIYEGTSEEVLQKGIGWLKGTSLPMGGESTHSVLSGHRGLPTAKLFTDLDRLEAGDEFFISNSTGILAYRVFEKRIVEPDDIDALSIVEGEDIITLLTCHPYMVNSQRLLVTGERIPYTGQLESMGDEDLLGNLSPAGKDLLSGVTAISLLIGLLALLVGKQARRKKGEGTSHE